MNNPREASHSEQSGRGSEVINRYIILQGEESVLVVIVRSAY